jgi:adenylyltransferase/sulfurtransferase
MAANLLARAGVGHLRIVDRDFVETNNLQRQTLFDEQDVADATPKAVAAAQKLTRVNSQITLEPIVADIDHHSITTLADGMNLIVDGSDNFELRYLINDLAVKRSIPWIYGGVIGAEGRVMTIVPGQTACLRCVTPEPPPSESLPTCDTAGVLGPAVGVIASIQSLEAIKILTGNFEAINRTLLVLDLWQNQIRQIDLSKLPDVDCPACGQRQFSWLNGERAGQSAVLCGRNAVQISPQSTRKIDFDVLASKLATAGKLIRNPFLLRLTVGDYQLTLFADGRAIISGTSDIAQARTLYARYIGG